MASSITIEGIDQALASLKYRSSNSPKARLIMALREYYNEEGAIDSLTHVDTNKLIDRVWNLQGNPKAIELKQKNFHSIKSAVNKDLNDLFQSEKNPEGITIGLTNIFEMSDSAKDKLLSSITDSIKPGQMDTLSRVSDALELINELMSEIESDPETQPELEKIVDLVKGLSQKIGSGNLDEYQFVHKDELENTGEFFGDGADVEEVDADDIEEVADDEVEEIDDDNNEDVDEILDEDSDVEEIDEDEIEDIEEVLEDDADVEELDDDEVEEIDEDDIEDVDQILDEDSGVEEIDEDEIEDIDEILEDDGDVEEVDADDIEEVADDEVEEIDDADIEDVDQILDEDSDVEEIDEDEIEDIEEVPEDDADVEEVDDDDIEELDEDEVKEIDDDDIEDVDEVLEDDADIEEIDADDVEELDDDEVEEIDDADIEEVDEVLDEDSDVEEIDEDEIEDIEEVPEDDADIEEIDADDFEELDDAEIEDVDEVLEDDADIEEIDADDFEELDDDEIEDVDAVLEDDADVEEIDADDIEELDDAEIEDVDEVLEDDADIEEIDADDVEELDDAEIEDVDEVLEDDAGIEEVEADDIEEVDEDEVEELEDAPAIGLPEDNLDESEAPLDPNLLAEQFDGYLGSMERHYNQYLKIPAGKYRIGSPAPRKDELPEVTKNLQEFYMGKYPVTNALFEVFIEKTGYKTTAEKKGYGVVYFGRFQKKKDPRTGLFRSVWNATFTNKKVPNAFWYQPLGPGSTLHNKRSHPVVQVSVADAQAFAAWTGKRLPTEIEWEAAARTKKGYSFPWGNEWKAHLCNHEKTGVSDTMPVDQFPDGANIYGLTDLLGNIMEWTADETKPSSLQLLNQLYHVVKGGGWICSAETTLFSRQRFPKDFTANILGFRLVAD